MNPNETLVSSLQRAVRAQDTKWTNQLIKDPEFQKLSGSSLDAILTPYSAFFQEIEIFRPFAAHPNLSKISPESAAEFITAAIRLNAPETIVKLFYLPQFKEIPQNAVHKIVQAILEFQTSELVNLFMKFALFKEEFNHNIVGMVESAIRNEDRIWMEQLFKNPHFRELPLAVNTALMRWVFRHRDRKLIGLTIQAQNFNEKIETTLRQELINTFLEKSTTQKAAIETYVIEQLLKHKDYPQFSPSMIVWMIGKAIALNLPEQLKQLQLHPQYANISGDALSEPMIIALTSFDKTILKSLLNHPHFNKMTGEPLGLLLEEAGRYNNKGLLSILIHHPYFSKVPSDSFKRLATMKIETPDAEIRQWVLTEPRFHEKYGEMIYDAIRRNEVGLIDKLLTDSILKNEVVRQLVNYSTTDGYFVSPYVIRDILREIFMTQDPPLIASIANNTLFDTRIEELMKQSINFDDEQLIEKMILDPLLRPKFQKIIREAPEKDRNRIYQIFTSQPNFSKKPPVLVEEVHSWQ